LHRNGTIAAAALAILALPLAGCDFPADADGTLDRARSAGVIRAGFVITGPGQSEPEGPDAAVVADWAEAEGLEVAWRGGAETDLIEQLTQRATAIVVGGFTADSVWTSEVGTSLQLPAGSGGEAIVILVAPGESALLWSLDRFIGSLPDRAR
jgi:hypothetical protein